MSSFDRRLAVLRDVQGVARILIIDDDRELRDSLKELLEFHGHEALIAADGEHGVDQFCRDAVDLVISDVFMPRKDGLGPMREIRKLSPDTPIIATSGSYSSNLKSLDVNQPDYLNMAREIAGARTIKKPFSWDEIHALICECLSGSLASL